MLDYKGKLVLAPMVRVSELPLRKLSLRYGADLVWGPEIVDKRLIASRRVLNPELGTVDFVSTKDPSKLTWRTAPELEKSRLVFQLGSSDPELAVQAAKLVAGDVSGIDLNCGCPKHFSIHSGMGAQLLQTPDKLVQILKALVEQVGRPQGVAISAKIRILESAQRTMELVRQIVQTGIACLTVHCRTTPMRPREPAIYDQLPEIAQICREAGVACLVNGDVEHRSQLSDFMEKYGVDGAMIARAAQNNPSCFSAEHRVHRVPILQICREFLDACFAYDYNTSHAKYNLTNFVGGKSPLYAKFAHAKSKEQMDAHLREAETLHTDTKRRALSTTEPSTTEPSKRRALSTEEPSKRRAPSTEELPTTNETKAKGQDEDEAEAEAEANEAPEPTGSEQSPPQSTRRAAAVA